MHYHKWRWFDWLYYFGRWGLYHHGRWRFNRLHYMRRWLNYHRRRRVSWLYYYRPRTGLNYTANDKYK
jgi:hypothetical protein